jgi:transposase
VPCACGRSLDFFRKTPGWRLAPALIFGGARSQRLGIRLRPIYVKAYVKRGKTDAANTEATCEAVRRPTMRFVPIKTREQQAAGMILKTRELLMRQQSQAANAFRAHMSELGIVAAAGRVSIAKLPWFCVTPKAATFRMQRATPFAR